MGRKAHYSPHNWGRGQRESAGEFDQCDFGCWPGGPAGKFFQNNTLTLKLLIQFIYRFPTARSEAEESLTNLSWNYAALVHYVILSVRPAQWEMKRTIMFDPDNIPIEACANTIPEVDLVDPQRKFLQDDTLTLNFQIKLTEWSSTPRSNAEEILKNSSRK